MKKINIYNKAIINFQFLSLVLLILFFVLISIFQNKIVYKNSNLNYSNLNYSGNAISKNLSKPIEIFEKPAIGIDQVIDINFKMKINSYSNFDCVFQTDTKGMRVEIGFPSQKNVSLFIDNTSFPHIIIDNFDFNKWYMIKILKDERNKMLKVWVDSRLVINEKDENVINLINIAVGTGYDKTRNFIGDIKDFNLNTSRIIKREKISLIIIQIKILLVLSFLLILLYMIKNTKYFNLYKIFLFLLPILFIVFAIIFSGNQVINYLYLFYSFCFLLLFLFLGFGLTLIVVPSFLRKYTFFLSPLIGFCLLSLTSWYFYILNFKGTDSYFIWILLISLILLVVGLIKWIFINKKESIFKKELFVPIIIAVFCFFIISYSSIKTEKLISNSAGGDIYSYMFQSLVMKELARNEIKNSMADEFLITKTVFNAYLNTAFFSSVFKIEPYKIQNINLVSFFIFSILILFIFAKEIFKYNLLGASIVSLLFGLSPFMAHIIYFGFQSQIISMGVMIFLFLIYFYLIKLNKFIDFLKFLPLSIIMTWGISLTYPHMLFFIYGIIFFTLFIVCIYNKSGKLFFNLIIFFIITLFVIFIFSITRFMAVIEYLLITKNTEVGYFLPWISPEKMFGFVGEHLSSPFPTILVFAYILTILFCIIYGFFIIYKENEKTLFLISLIPVVLVISGSLILSAIGEPYQRVSGFGGYKQFKLLSFFLPMLLVSNLWFFKEINLLDNNKQQKLQIIFLIVFFSVNLGSAYDYAINSKKYNHNLSSDLIALEKVDKNNSIKSINIIMDEWAQKESYFLLHKKLFLGKFDLQGEWNLYSKKPIINIPYSEKININSSYFMIKTKDINAGFGEGWNFTEEELVWTKSDKSEINIFARKENISSKVKINFSSFIKDEKLSIYLNGRKIKECDNNICEIENFSFKKGSNLLLFKSSLPPILFGNKEKRYCGVAFEYINFEILDK